MQLAQALLGSTNGQNFGYSVALSDDGSVVAVGAPLASIGGNSEAGLVQVYEMQNGSWTARGPPLFGRNASDQFGSSVSLSSDGSILACGEPTHAAIGDRSGNVRVFVYGPTNQYELLGLELPGAAATDYFGTSVKLSGDGYRLAVGAPFVDVGSASTRNITGQVQVFTYSNSTWQQLGQPLNGSSHLDAFGMSLDISHDGTVLCSGAPRNLKYGGYVQCFQYDELVTKEWKPLGLAIRNSIAPLRYDDGWGQSISLSGNIRVAIGSPGKNSAVADTGLAAVYELSPDNNFWNVLGSPLGILSNNPVQGSRFGYSLSLSGNVLAVGIPGADEVGLYQLLSTNTSWVRYPQTMVGRPNSQYGLSVKLVPANFTLAIGSPYTIGTSPGTVTVYQS